MRNATLVARLWVFSGALGAAACARSADAQVVRGVVRDSASGLPIMGAVVTTYDSADRIGRRSLTSDRGTYFVTAPPAARRIRVVRLGFRPVDVRIPTQRDSVAQLDVVMVHIPYTLQAVQVTGGANCPRRSDRAAAMSLLEQARAGLLATVVARSEKPARMKRLMVDRRVDASSGRVTRHHVRVEFVPSTIAAFGAAKSAGEFVRRGFAMDGGEGAVFHAPDADILLDDAFANGYCFHIMPSVQSRVGQVGLGFRAANSRRDRIDVDGALWIDTVARALVDIEYRYVGLGPELTRHEPGGRVAFRELPNGVVLIDRWMLRIVGFEVDTGRRRVEEVGRTREMADPVDRRYVIGEVGGELARATFEDGYTWVASLGTLSVVVTNAAGVLLPAVIVGLDDTNYESVTDSAGRLVIEDLAPGPYTARIMDDRLDPINLTLETPLSFVAARGQTTVLNMFATTAEDFVAERCVRDRVPGFRGRSPPPPGVTYLIARVFAPNKEPLAGVQWALRLYQNGVHREGIYGPNTGTDGIFVYCGLPIGAQLTVSFQREGMLAGSVTRRLTDPITVIAVRMDPDPKKRK